MEEEIYINEIPDSYEDYLQFLAECDEAEEEFWKELCEEEQAEYWIEEYKNIF